MNYLYGILFVIAAIIVGGFLKGFDRKITARMQGRKGPPILQPFYDVFKLLSKETLVVNRLQSFFIIGFFIFVLFTGVLFFSGGDLLLVIFALTLASIFLVLSAFCANSPFSSVGAERELMQMMTYEPMFFVTAIGLYMVDKSFAVSDIISRDTMSIAYLPGVFLGFIYILTIKLRKSPFDLSTSHHAHQEIVKGITTEISGRNLALIEMAEWFESVFFLGIVALFFITSNPYSWIVAIVVCLLAYFFEILVDNSNARVKWQAMLKTTWVATLILGFVNLLVVDFMK